MALVDLQSRLNHLFQKRRMTASLFALHNAKHPISPVIKICLKDVLSA